MGWRQAAVVANLVIVQGPGEGIFSYSPRPGAGNLVASTGIAMAGTDRFGNAYLTGDTVYHKVSSAQWMAISLSGGTGNAELGFWSATSEAGPWTENGFIAPGFLNFPPLQGPFTQIASSVQIANPNPLVPGSEFWLLPSGDTSGVTDAANAAAAFAAASTVHLLAGGYYVNAPIVVPSGSGLIGAFPTQADNFSNYGSGSLQAQGTVITPVGEFTNAAVIACQNSTGTQQGGQVLANFSIQANTTLAGSGSMCILLDGAVAAGYITGVTAIRGDAACLRIRADATSGAVPDQWTIENCTFAGSRSGHGVLADDVADFNFINVYSHDNALDGWNVRGGTGAAFIKCRAETNIGNGFRFTGFLAAGEDLMMTGCNSELNQKSGYLFDATGFATLGQYNLTGCRSWHDGVAASGILAGFYDQGCKSAVLLNGCTALASATSPAYGAYEGSAAFGMALTGCRMQGVTAATHDDGTNTNILSNLVPVPF